jgi:hypothetical protein
MAEEGKFAWGSAAGKALPPWPTVVQAVSTLLGLLLLLLVDTLNVLPPLRW